MSNEITTTAAEKVTKELCLDYLASQNTNLTQGEQKQYLAVAMALNLNPFLREIYPIKYKDKMTLVTGYQVYIRRAEEFPQYDGFDTYFEGEGENLSCVCNVYRKDRTRPTSARVFFSEYNQGNTMWQGKPHVMLEKCAIGTAFRRAFPSEFNGMPYTSEEIRMEDELKQNGYTEVKAEHVVDESADIKQFLKECAAVNPDAFASLKENLKNHGWSKPSEIPADQVETVKNWWKDELALREKFADKLNETETAEEVENG